MGKQVVVRLSDDVAQAVRAYATEKGIGVYEAAERLIKTAIGRRAALARYQPRRVAMTTRKKRATARERVAAKRAAKKGKG